MTDPSKRNTVDNARVSDDFIDQIANRDPLVPDLLATADPFESHDPELTYDPDLTLDRPGASTPRRDQGPIKVFANSRYSPTELHACGGLGAVFRARDEELNRVVALKEILPEHSHKAHYQEKFVFEAKITGLLEHPGIVPIYGLGRYSDNQPYYAMRFIRGRSFSELIREFHKCNKPLTAASYHGREFRSLLRRLIETCNAIHFAHEHGVLHRDIKPANVMLGEYGETLVVDWGLAKLFDPLHPSEDEYEQSTKIDVQGSGSSKTSHGSVIGTPMYMSPEQAYGKVDQLDGRTDVYSLGAVLFHLITGENPIDGKTSVDIIVAVRQGKIRSVRGAASAAPGALASICRKAMAMEPSQRYQTAIELADDIDRWVNDEAVLAHLPHEHVLERAGRLIRRYRSWTISGAAALITIAIISVVAGFMVNHARKEQKLAKEDAVERYRESQKAIDTWLVQSTDALQFFPGANLVRKRLLQRAVEDYERLAQRKSNDPQLILERGRALIRVGDLTLMQQEFESAEEHYADAMQVFRTGVEIAGLTVAFQSELANVHIRIGNAYAEQNKIPEAETEFRDAIEQLNEVAGRTDDPLPRKLLATAYVNAGKLVTGLNSENAIKYLTDGLYQYELLAASTDETIQLGKATARDLLGQIHRDAGDHDRAMKYFDESVAALQQLVDDQPDHPNYLNALASVSLSKAASFRTRGLDAAMFEALHQAVEHYRALRNALPGQPRYDLNLAIAQTALGLAQHESALNSEADLTLGEALSLLDDLVRTYGQSSRILEALANCHDARGQVFVDLKEDPGDASRISQDILLLLSQSATTGDEVIRLFEHLAIAQSHLAQAYQRQDQPNLSEQKFAEAIKNLESLIENQGAVPRLVNALAYTHYHAGLLQYGKKLSQAESHFRIARDHWMDIEREGNASYADNLAWLLAICPIDSVNDPIQARRYAEQAVKLAPDNAKFHSTLALTHALSGDADQAIEVLQRCKKLRGRWVDRDLFVLSLTEHQAGNTDEAKRAFENAEAWRVNHQPFEPGVIRLREIVSAELIN